MSVCQSPLLTRLRVAAICANRGCRVQGVDNSCSVSLFLFFSSGRIYCDSDNVSVFCPVVPVVSCYMVCLLILELFANLRPLPNSNSLYY